MRQFFSYIGIVCLGILMISSCYAQEEAESILVHQARHDQEIEKLKQELDALKKHVEWLTIQMYASRLRLWLSADRIQAQDGDRIGIWPDQSGLGNSPTATEDRRPTYKSAAILGYPALRFERGQDMELVGSPHFNFTEATIFTVTSKMAGNVIFGITEEGTPYHNMFGIFATPYLWHVTRQAAYTYVQHEENPTTPYIQTAVFGRGPYEMALYINGIKNKDIAKISDETKLWQRTPEPFASVPRRVTICNSGSGRDFIASGDIAEILVYEGKLNDIERIAIEAYLSGKYGIPIQK